MTAVENQTEVETPTAPYVGALTSIKNGNVAMTVTKVIDNEGCPLQIECMYFTGNVLKTFYGDIESFIGFGENLVFSGGCFIYAFDDEDEDDSAE